LLSQFYKYWRNDKLLVVDFNDLLLLFTTAHFPWHQFSKYLQRPLILCCLHKEWYKVLSMPSHAHILILVLCLYNFWLTNMLYQLKLKNLVDRDCHQQVIHLLMLLQIQRKSDLQLKSCVLLYWLASFHDFILFSIF